MLGHFKRDGPGKIFQKVCGNPEELKKNLSIRNNISRSIVIEIHYSQISVSCQLAGTGTSKRPATVQTFCEKT